MQHVSKRYDNVAIGLAVPLLGLAITYARGKPINFGLFQIALPAGPVIAKDTGRLIKQVHEFVAELILALAFVHAAAALWPHHVRKDNVLKRMLPDKLA